MTFMTSCSALYPLNHLSRIAVLSNLSQIAWGQQLLCYWPQGSCVTGKSCHGGTAVACLCMCASHVACSPSHICVQSISHGQLSLTHLAGHLGQCMQVTQHAPFHLSLVSFQAMSYALGLYIHSFIYYIYSPWDIYSPWSQQRANRLSKPNY